MCGICGCFNCHLLSNRNVWMTCVSVLKGALSRGRAVLMDNKSTRKTQWPTSGKSTDVDNASNWLPVNQMALWGAKRQKNGASSIVTSQSEVHQLYRMLWVKIHRKGNSGNELKEHSSCCCHLVLTGWSMSDADDADDASGDCADDDAVTYSTYTTCSLLVTCSSSLLKCCSSIALTSPKDHQFVFAFTSHKGTAKSCLFIGNALPSWIMKTPSQWGVNCVRVCNMTSIIAATEANISQTVAQWSKDGWANKLSIHQLHLCRCVQTFVQTNSCLCVVQMMFMKDIKWTTKMNSALVYIPQVSKDSFWVKLIKLYE